MNPGKPSIPPTLQDLLTPLAKHDAAAAGGVVARVLVHEIGNGLNPMGLQVELLRRRCAQDARAMEVLDGLRDAVRELGGMLQRVRGFAHEAAPPETDDEARTRAIDALTEYVRGA